MPSITITFEGETLLDVANQANDFAALVIGAELSKNQSKTNVPPTGEKNTKGRGSKAKDAPVSTGTPIVPQTPEEAAADAAAAPKVEAADTKALEKTKEEALDILRKVFGKGEAGQKAVRAITKHYEVKKAGDVPVEKAAELLAKAKAALEAVAEDAPI